MLTFSFALRPEASQPPLDQLLNELEKHDINVQFKNDSLIVTATGDDAWRQTGAFTVAMIAHDDVITRQNRVMAADAQDRALSGLSDSLTTAATAATTATSYLSSWRAVRQPSA